MGIVGIDLGTTNSLIAVYDTKTARPMLLPLRDGKRLLPSVVGIDKAGKLHVGASARNQLVAAPERTLAEVKRLMGTSERLRLGDQTYSPQEIASLILRHLKEDAEAALGAPVTEAVITVPAYFTDAQRQATRDAGELAGFRVERIINEPTAAAMAYGIDHLGEDQHVLVFDLGGGTLDVSVLELFENVLEVKASAGNNRLGGMDFDQALALWLKDGFLRDHGVDVSSDRTAMVRLRLAAEQAKIELSSAESTQVLLPFLAVKDGQPCSLETELTRAELDKVLAPFVDQAFIPVEQALKDAGLLPAQVTHVLLVGGSSRIPMIQRRLTKFFGKEPRREVHPDEAIALGAAVQAGLKSGQISSESGIVLTDVCPYTLGVAVSEKVGAQFVDGFFRPIIPRNATIPCSRTESFSTLNDGQDKVTVRIYQGEARMVRDNVLLDVYSVEGVPPGAAGTQHIEITFTYDINGILSVSTKVTSTGKEARIVVEKNGARMNAHERSEAKDRIEVLWSGADDSNDDDGSEGGGSRGKN